MVFFGAFSAVLGFIPPYSAPTRLQHTIYAFYAEKIIFQQKKKAQKGLSFLICFLVCRTVVIYNRTVVVDFDFVHHTPTAKVIIGCVVALGNGRSYGNDAYIIVYLVQG